MESLSSSNNQGWLEWFLKGVLILGFLLLISRLFELQIIKGKYYRTLAEENRIKRVVIPAPRGRIIARGGEIVVGNREVKKQILFKDNGEIEKIEATSETAQEEIISEFNRDYLLGAKAAHLSGYLGESSPDEVGRVDPKCVEKGPRKIGDMVGRSGLEEAYDCLLRGTDGEELIEVDIRGKMVRVLGRKNAIVGEDIKTNIDYALQNKIASLLEEKKGAIIVTSTEGEVLALFSSPSFDPNLFVGKANLDKVAKILKDENLPLFDRAIGGLYHPGSIFKPVVAVAALTEGKIDKNYKFTDPGVIRVGEYNYFNWYYAQYGGTEGEIEITRAIARSTDTFFYKLGEILGIDTLARWANKFGLGEKTGIDLPGEIAGLVPTPEWKQRVKGERWFLGNTYHVSIGQGDLALTPIGVNSEITTIASGGLLCRPEIVSQRVSNITALTLPKKCKDIGIKNEALDLVKKGMIQACSQGGTGYTFFDFKPQVACKTGTAETNEDGKTHAWFGVFAPADFPEIVTTVLVEGGGEGSSVGGPIARDILNFYFLGREL